MPKNNLPNRRRTFAEFEESEPEYSIAACEECGREVRANRGHPKPGPDHLGFCDLYRDRGR